MTSYSGNQPIASEPQRTLPATKACGNGRLLELKCQMDPFRPHFFLTTLKHETLSYGLQNSPQPRPRSRGRTEADDSVRRSVLLGIKGRYNVRGCNVSCVVFEWAASENAVILEHVILMTVRSGHHEKPFYVSHYIQCKR